MFLLKNNSKPIIHNWRRKTMKEKLITFTRNRKNLIWLYIIAMLVLLVVYFLCNIELSNMSLIALILILIVALLMNILPLLLVAIWKLFDVDEEKIRNNNFFILLLSIEDYIWFPIYAVEYAIYDIIKAVIGISTGILGSIIAFICLAILSFFLGDIVAKHFSKKIK